MYEELIEKTEKAIESSMNWAKNGWDVSFGPRHTKVNSLEEAEGLDKTFVYKDEAVNYWKQARLTGYDAGISGQKALEALKNKDLKSAEDHLYFCQYIEKPFADSSKTWADLYKDVKEKITSDINSLG